LYVFDLTMRMYVADIFWYDSDQRARRKRADISHVWPVRPLGCKYGDVKKRTKNATFDELSHIDDLVLISQRSGQQYFPERHSEASLNPSLFSNKLSGGPLRSS
jgi:hypothetical protein